MLYRHVADNCPDTISTYCLFDRIMYADIADRESRAMYDRAVKGYEVSKNHSMSLEDTHKGSVMLENLLCHNWQNLFGDSMKFMHALWKHPKSMLGLNPCLRCCSNATATFGSTQTSRRSRYSGLQDEAKSRSAKAYIGRRLTLCEDPLSDRKKQGRDGTVSAA